MHRCPRLLSLVTVLLSLLLAISALEAAPAPSPSPLSRPCGMLDISIDPRIELLAVIQYLSGSQMVSRDEDGYAGAIDAWFAGHCDHPVLELLPAMEELGFSYDLPVVSFLEYESLPLELKSSRTDAHYSSMNARRWEEISRKADWDALLPLVNDFYKVSDFAGFYLTQRERFERMVDGAYAVLSGREDMIAHLADWYGDNLDSYNFLISPLQGGNGYGPSLINASGGTDAYCVMNFGAGQDSASTFKNLAYMIFHEFSHSYVNPLIDDHYSELEKAEELFEPIAKKMASQAYGSWWICLAEHFVRAAETRLLYSFFKDESILQSTARQTSRGFIYIDHVIQSLAAYERAREAHGIGFRDYFPELVQEFLSLKDHPRDEYERFLLFRGILNNVTMSPDVLIVYPDPERVEGVAKSILPTISFMVERLGKEAVTDSQALSMDLKDRPLILYGTVDDNLWLARHRDALPFTILPDRVIADKEYPGTNLRVISCLPHPENPQLGINIYTAQTIEAMHRCNAVFHGNEDWLVTNTELQILGSGFYNKDLAGWRFE